jgi:hypothetical protein
LLGDGKQFGVKMKTMKWMAVAVCMKIIKASSNIKKRNNYHCQSRALIVLVVVVFFSKLYYKSLSKGVK